MARAPVLPSLAKARKEKDKPTYAGTANLGADPYAERLVKYIPGEAIAFFLPFASLEGISDGQLIAALAIAEVGSLLWSLDRNHKLDEPLRRPRALVALWSVVVFLVWALGTSAATQELVSWPALTCSLILAGTALLVPKVDDLMTGFIRDRQDGSA